MRSFVTRYYIAAAGAIAVAIACLFFLHHAVRQARIHLALRSIEEKIRQSTRPGSLFFQEPCDVEEDIKTLASLGGINAANASRYLASPSDGGFLVGVTIALKLPPAEAADVLSAYLRERPDAGRSDFLVMVLSAFVDESPHAAYAEIFRGFVFNEDISVRSMATFGIFKCLEKGAVPLLKESVSHDLRLEYAVREIKTTGPPGGRSAAIYLGFLFCEDIENFLAAEIEKPHCPEVLADILKVLYENESPKAFRFCLERMASEKDDLAWAWMMRTVMRHGSLDDRERIIRSVRSLSKRRQITVAQHVRDHGTEREQFEMCIEAIISEEVAENIRMFFLDEDRLEALIDKTFHRPETRVRDTRVLHFWGRRMVEDGILKID